jgi:hypothetical protein
MTRVLIARMDVLPGFEEEFNRWYNGEHMVQASAIPGFGRHHLRFRRLVNNGGYGTLARGPEYYAVYELQGEPDLLQSINSDQYRAWSGDFLKRWRERTMREVSIVAEQIFGREGPLPHRRILLAQVDPEEGADKEFTDWLLHGHLPTADRVASLVSDHRIFRALELRGKYWTYQPSPRYTIVYEVATEFAPRAVMDSADYKRWSAELSNRWSGRIDGTWGLCEKIFPPQA